MKGAKNDFRTIYGRVSPADLAKLDDLGGRFGLSRAAFVALAARHYVEQPTDIVEDLCRQIDREAEEQKAKLRSMLKAPAGAAPVLAGPGPLRDGKRPVSVPL